MLIAGTQDGCSGMLDASGDCIERLAAGADPHGDAIGVSPSCAGTGSWGQLPAIGARVACPLECQGRYGSSCNAAQNPVMDYQLTCAQPVQAACMAVCLNAYLCAPAVLCFMRRNDAPYHMACQPSSSHLARLYIMQNRARCQNWGSFPLILSLLHSGVLDVLQ